MPDRPPLPAPPPGWIRAGVWLYAAGLGLFCAAVGSMLGFWAADRGVRLMPEMLSAVALLVSASLLLGVLGRWLWGKAVTLTPKGARVSRRVLLALVIVLGALIARLGVFYAEQPSPLTRLSAELYEDAFAADARAYAEFDRAMERLIRRIEQDKAFAEGATDVLSPEQEALLRESWADLYEYAFSLDRVRLFYEDWYRFDPSRAERPWHLRSFLLSLSAELALYEKSARFTALVTRNPNARKFLDAPHPDRGLPANTLSFFRQDLLGSRDQARVIAGEQYLRALALGAGAETEARALGVGWLWDAAERHLKQIHALPDWQRVDMTLRGDTQILRRVVRRGWFPAQKGVAEWFGDTRVRRIGWYLITPEQLAALDPQLSPGDILLSRKNWYLSNVGLPGFWPHAILYLGGPDKFIAYFDDSAVRAWVREITGEDLAFHELLARSYPDAWRHYQAGEHGLTHRVMEAISEGVVFNSLEHAAGDYLAALRPKVDKATKARAVLEAFAHLEKPYDFDFDFATDHALVCTELVWRAYRPSEAHGGLDLPLVSVAGRRTLPAQQIVRIYVEDSKHEKLEFVAFLEGREQEQRAVLADEAAFAATLERTKWDVLQK